MKSSRSSAPLNFWVLVRYSVVLLCGSFRASTNGPNANMIFAGRKSHPCPGHRSHPIPSHPIQCSKVARFSPTTISHLFPSRTGPGSLIGGARFGNGSDRLFHDGPERPSRTRTRYHRNCIAEPSLDPFAFRSSCESHWLTR